MTLRDKLRKLTEEAIQGQKKKEAEEQKEIEKEAQEQIKKTIEMLPKILENAAKRGQNKVAIIAVKERYHVKSVSSDLPEQAHKLGMREVVTEAMIPLLDKLDEYNLEYEIEEDRGPNPFLLVATW